MKIKKTVSLVVVITLLLSLGLITSPAISASVTIWHVPEDFTTIQEAIDSPDVLPGDVIIVGEGNHAGAYVTKSVTIRGAGGAVIDTGPMHPAGLSMGFRLLAGSDGAIIRNLTFQTDLSIMNGEAVDDVVVTQCTFLNSIQAISNLGGNGWEISHNEITGLRTRSGGGIGILIADSSGGINVANNLVIQNRISGTLHVWEDDCGGYEGSGIVIYADFRWGRLGATSMTGNQVLHNTVSLVSDNPSLVDVVAFELSQVWTVPPEPIPIVIHDNIIGFNDFRGTTLQIAVTPEELYDENTFAKNLGDNRGGGSATFHPMGH
ncbi:MAG: hypothetical protein JSV77_09020 [Dehalococcoidales bacterium]|nr:MAG: hypothetical protein JSV77_09020 [Dehalococcoidales bacterium]